MGLIKRYKENNVVLNTAKEKFRNSCINFYGRKKKWENFYQEITRH